MISFGYEAQVSGRAKFAKTGSYRFGGGPTWNTTVLVPSALSADAKIVYGEAFRRRSPFDQIWTGAESAQGNKPCRHTQLSGTVRVAARDATLHLDGPTTITDILVEKDGDTVGVLTFNDNQWDFYWDDTMDVVPRDRINFHTRDLHEHYMILEVSGIDLTRPTNDRDVVGVGYNWYSKYLWVDAGDYVSSDQYPNLSWGRVLGVRDDGAIMTETGSMEFQYTGKAIVTVSRTAYAVKSDGQVVSRGYNWSHRDWDAPAGRTYTARVSNQMARRILAAKSAAPLGFEVSLPDPLWIPKNQLRSADCDGSVDVTGDHNWYDSKVNAIMNALYHTAMVARKKTTPYDIRELHDQIMDKVPYFAGNSLAYVKDIRDILGTAKSLAEFATNPSINTAASAWLSTRYGTRLTIKDTEELLEGIRDKYHDLESASEFGFEKFRARHTESESYMIRDIPFETKVVYNSSVTLRREDLARIQSITRDLLEWDAIPTAQNVWDLIPYSFVADWFVDVEGVCSSIDRRMAEAYYHILCVVDSVKRTTHITALPWMRETDDFDYVIDVTATDYNRTVATHLSFTPLRLEQGHLASKNVMDGVALIVNNVK